MEVNRYTSHSGRKSKKKEMHLLRNPSSSLKERACISIFPHAQCIRGAPGVGPLRPEPMEGGRWLLAGPATSPPSQMCSGSSLGPDGAWQRPDPLRYLLRVTRHTCHWVSRSQLTHTGSSGDTHWTLWSCGCQKSEACAANVCFVQRLFGRCGVATSAEHMPREGGPRELFLEPQELLLELWPLTITQDTRCEPGKGGRTSVLGPDVGMLVPVS